jgi:hypothetical protein
MVQYSRGPASADDAVDNDDVQVEVRGESGQEEEKVGSLHK